LNFSLQGQEGEKANNHKEQAERKAVTRYHFFLKKSDGNAATLHTMELFT
jgi:hypothetical protein